MSYTRENIQPEMADLSYIYHKARATGQMLFDKTLVILSTGELDLAKVKEIERFVKAIKEINDIFSEMISKYALITTCFAKQIRQDEKTQRTDENGSGTGSDASDDQMDLEETENSGGSNSDFKSSDNEKRIGDIVPETEKSKDNLIGKPLNQSGATIQNRAAANESSPNSAINVAVTQKSNPDEAMAHENTENAGYWQNCVQSVEEMISQLSTTPPLPIQLPDLPILQPTGSPPSRDFSSQASEHEVWPDVTQTKANQGAE